MKDRLLVLDSGLQDLAGFGSATLSVVQANLPNNVMVVFDEDISEVIDHMDFHKFNSYDVVSDSCNYSRAALERYKLSENHICEDYVIGSMEDLIEILNDFYKTPKLTGLAVSVPMKARALSEPCCSPEPKCTSNGTTQKSNTGRFDGLF